MTSLAVGRQSWAARLRRPHITRRTFRERAAFLAFIAPNFMLFGVFTFYPLLYNVYLSFTKWNMVSPVIPFVGVENCPRAQPTARRAQLLSRHHLLAHVHHGRGDRHRVDLAVAQTAGVGADPLARLVTLPALIACVMTGWSVHSMDISSQVPAASAAPARRVAIVGHRGAAGVAPENTLPAFQRGIDAGADAVELDVHLSKDGQLVVIHDPRVDRTTNGTGVVREMPLAEIKHLNAAARFKGAGDYGVLRVPTLQEVFDLIGRRAVQVVIEIKLDANGRRYPGIEERVIEVVRRNNAGGAVAVASFDFETLRRMQSLEPKIARQAVISTAYLSQMGMKQKGPADIAADLAALGVQAVGINKTFASTEMVTALKQAGLGVSAWTVNDFVEMWKLIDLGVESITTDRPDILVEKYRQGR
jgi:glycerophosphoryl diester phosphodiesterase